ncbi:MAG: NAD-dependent epimerase [Planctomycetota bacterium]|nr:NAD-dependent epimerase [Planctomycetota bacterium]
MKKILVTGAAGFIGFHFAKRLLDAGYEVVGLDNVNDYYDPKLKRDRLSILEPLPNFSMREISLEDRTQMEKLFSDTQFDRVVHLAAQAGVRYSIDNPMAYIDSNIVGTMNILEGCRHQKVPHLVYASSSSVYGSNTSQPFSVHQNVDHPISLYAATKKSNELMAHTYSHLFKLPTTGLRFFTVYGPWGRPDMALYKFTKAIFESKPIDVYNHGKMQRDFTYVDDIVTAMVGVMEHVPLAKPSWDSSHPDPATSSAPYRVYNIGNHQPTELAYFIEVIEKAIGRTAVKNYLPMQMGDVPATYADVADLQADIGFTPDTSIEYGVQKFVDWYRSYHNIMNYRA